MNTSIVKLIVLPVIALMMASSLACMNKFSEVEAQEYLLTDEDGNVRAVLGFADEDQEEPGIYLFDNDGEVRLSITVLDGETPGMGIFDSKGEIRALIDLDEDEAPGVYLYDEYGNMRAMYTLFDDGTPDMSFFGEDEEYLWGSP